MRRNPEAREHRHHPEEQVDRDREAAPDILSTFTLLGYDPQLPGPEDPVFCRRGGRVPQFDSFRRLAEKRLRVLEAAVSLGDLRQLPGNRLEALKGDREGQYSIRINAQWRICFTWPAGADGPEDVEIVDYH